MRLTNTARAGENGNAFFIILIAVILFAALAMTFSRGMQQGGETISKRQADIAATDILNYAQVVERTVGRIMQDDHSETFLNFAGTPTDGPAYTNPDTECPVDECKIFHPTGGNITPQSPVVKWLDKTKSSEPFFGYYVFTAKYCIDGVGDSTCLAGQGIDLLLMLPYINDSICTAINSKLGIATLPAPAALAAFALTDKFNGTFPSTGGPILISHAAMTGKNSGCIRDTANLQNVFYSVLLAR